MMLAAELCCDMCGFKRNVCDNSRNVVTGSDTDATAVLDGFTVTSGNADVAYSDRGGGITSDSGAFTVRNCVFADNFADKGGAVSLWASTPTLVNCVWRGNTAHRGGGGIFMYRTDVAMTNCKFIANKSYLFGGAMNTSGSDSTLINCMFFGNTAEASGGAIFYDNYSFVTLVNCVLSGNRAVSSGGAIYHLKGSDLNLTNCTFVGNITDDQRGALMRVNGEFDNCIFWDNSDADGTGESSQIRFGDPVVDFSCIQGWTGALGGLSNTGDDPVFADHDGQDNIVGTKDDDLRLSPRSPRIDVGNNVPVPLWITTDLDGLQRFVDISDAPDSGNGTPPIVDMGAYEHGVDCNGNGISDEAEIAAGTSEDCDNNTIPDECETDTDGDGFIDDCDRCEGFDDLSDADNDGVPDGCDDCPYEPALAEPSEPGYEITCDDAIDNDCDTLTGESDSDCLCQSR
ncbi:MAG: right-handed parallel beta-helix repeat-containing protein [Phycisphaerales bacterium]|nr:MAG: right-handed parallel beta-helix repeat-containing protein [Phycisphaerales bacterium]